MASPATPYDGSVAPECEVSSKFISVILAGFGAYKVMAARILAEQGLVVTDDPDWVSLANAIRVQRRLHEQFGASVLLQVGLRIPDHFHLPGAPMDGHAALMGIDVVYQESHRGGNVGVYGYERVGLRAAKVICENPYVCSLDEGLITGFARRVEALAAVRHEPGECRERGDLRCVFLVQW